jgi:iron complex transport system substrate-binding protein
LLTYLRFTGCPLGLLMNFGADTMLEGIKRIVNNFPDGTPTVPRGETTTQDENTKSPTASEATQL